ncbi:uncharacterized protein VP01_646g4 [Puccinia sorghi]|uniref:Uncharacterized protein n=1 Tax=Puccinia sorghi TaxID=27349 RepID=A0A0L6UFP4_9BASI|nr:uncharacterized protein VP01_646g4 [Puccinia sorghi]
MVMLFPQVTWAGNQPCGLLIQASKHFGFILITFLNFQTDMNFPPTLARILSDPPAQVDMSKLITQIRNFTTFLKQSTQNASTFTSTSNALIGNSLEIIATVPTYSNSTYAMFGKAFKFQHPICLFCERNTLLAKYNLFKSAWKNI